MPNRWDLRWTLSHLGNSFLVLLAITVVQSIHLVSAGLGLRREKRYNVEVLGIRFLKGIGSSSSRCVTLPFVMVMMSLKNQQLLLSNPLDFSLNFEQGFRALFRSYFELFTQYHLEPTL